MKYLLTLLFLCGSLTIFAQTNIDGNWKGTRETPNGTFEVNYTFKVDGKTLTGTLKAQFGEVQLENGKIDSNKISYLSPSTARPSTALVRSLMKMKS